MLFLRLFDDPTLLSGGFHDGLKSVVLFSTHVGIRSVRRCTQCARHRAYYVSAPEK